MSSRWLPLTTTLALTVLLGGEAYLSSAYADAAASGAVCSKSGASACNTNGCFLCNGTTWVTQPLLHGTTASACSTSIAGMIRWTGTGFEGCDGSSWGALGGGSTQLVGVYSSSTAVSNYSVVFSGAANSQPSLSGTVLTLPSNTLYMVVELWGGGGGGAGGAGNGTATSGGSGASTCFGSNATACTSPTLSASGGTGGITSAGSAAGIGSGGDVNLKGGGGGGTYTASGGYGAGGTGGSAPLGGGGGYGGNYTGGYAAAVGGAFGGGGGGGGAYGTGGWPGGGGGSGGYAAKLMTSPSGTYYYTIGSGGTAGVAGSFNGTGAVGAAGGAGGIKISVYVSAASSSGSGSSSSTVGAPAGSNMQVQYNNAGSLAGAANLIYTSTGSVGIGTTSPGKLLDLRKDGTDGTTGIRIVNGSLSSGGGGTIWFNDGTQDIFALGMDGSSGNAAANIEPFLWTGTGKGLRFGSGANVILFLSSTGHVGIGTLTPSYTLHVNGSVAGTSAYTNLSDKRMKKDVTPLSYGLETVMHLQPVGFNWIKQDQDWEKKHQIGFIAQDVEPIVPEVVTTANDEMKTKSIAYGSLVPVLVKGMQELKAENDDLRKRLDALEKREK